VNTCPHCGSADCLPLWRKFTLGPAASAQCRICGFKVGVDVAKAWLAMLPTALLVIATAFGLLRDPVTLVLLLLLCLGATFILYAVWVPLLPDELTNVRMVEAGRARIAEQRGQPQNE
jgi:prepilin signal peptidase PulO-like enzyme (type II secretory pathway)